MLEKNRRDSVPDRWKSRLQFLTVTDRILRKLFIVFLPVYNGFKFLNFKPKTYLYLPILELILMLYYSIDIIFSNASLII